MLAGLDAYNGNFLADLAITETNIGRENQQVSSGVRVSQPSDDPGAIGSILDYQDSIDQITQEQTNLGLATTAATAADGALQSASTLMDQLVSLASQGASSTVTAAARTTFAQQVQGIESQLVSLANTTVQGRFIFGGDDPQTQPYIFNWSSPEGVVQNSTPTNTGALQNVQGGSIVPRMTAQEIFDARNPDGTAAPGNVFQAAYSLGQALQNNDQAGIETAITSLQSGVAQLGQASAFYGNVENWIQASQQTATQDSANLQQALSNMRDTDVAAVATQMTTDQTALQAALAAHGSLTVRSLFSYLG
jgi:flagellar hook-associated protein 3 FlgL